VGLFNLSIIRRLAIAGALTGALLAANQLNYRYSLGFLKARCEKMGGFRERGRVEKPGHLLIATKVNDPAHQLCRSGPCSGFLNDHRFLSVSVLKEEPKADQKLNRNPSKFITFTAIVTTKERKKCLESNGKIVSSIIDRKLICAVPNSSTDFSYKFSLNGDDKSPTPYVFYYVEKGWILEKTEDHAILASASDMGVSGSALGWPLSHALTRMFPFAPEDWSSYGGCTSGNNGIPEPSEPYYSEFVKVYGPRNIMYRDGDGR
jgi:hypothetical protein